MTRSLLLPALCLALAAPALATPALAQQAAPLPPVIPTPQDRPYPGPLTLAVDATDLTRHIMAVHETIPVAASATDLVLLYPEWIPGNHGPTGPIALLAGLAVHTDAGQPVAWTRDPVNQFAFHLPVPAGAHAVSVDFQYLSPVQENEGRIVMTPAMLDLQWNTVVLYPAGTMTRDIPVNASLKLPAGWHFATALTASGPDGDAAGGQPHFATVPLNVLVDSPLYAGRNVARLDLAPGARVPVHLNVVADNPADLAVSPEQLSVHRAIVTQATRLFGSQHYDHYEFLLALSEELGGEGLEHHRSSENAVGHDYFTAWDKTFAERDLLAHEYTHSWNGKYRRPADLYSPDFNVVPERDSLLWVYEGMTQYWGEVLAARSGLWTHQQALDALAADAAYEQDEVGRAWRNLEDTTNSPIFVRRRDMPWLTWQRSEDYYVEGVLIWLDADTLIREQSHGARSLDDFARAFFGTNDGSFVVSTYSFDDVVHALNTVQPYDWASFLNQRLQRVGGAAPLDGLARGGYRLTMTDQKSAWLTSQEHLRQRRDFTASIGLSMRENKVADVVWGSPAFKAGLVKGDTILGINGDTTTDPDALATAITAAKSPATQPIQLLVMSGKHYRTLLVDDHTGLRYPHLERTGAGSGSIDAILTPRS